MNYLERRRHEAWLRGESQGQASVFQGKETKGPHMTQLEDDAARLHPHPHGAKPMSSEPVGGMVLELLTEYVRRGAESATQKVTTFSGREVDLLLSALTELKSRRAQQAEPPAGCAEMATAIEKAIADAEESGFDEWRCGIIHDKLAPLFAIPPGCAELASGIADAASCIAHGDYAANFHIDEMLPVIAAKLAPLFTLLAECEPYLKEIDDEYTRQFDEAIGGSSEEVELAIKVVAIDELRCKIASLTEKTERIDAALGKGDADGGREEGKENQ